MVSTGCKKYCEKDFCDLLFDQRCMMGGNNVSTGEQRCVEVTRGRHRSLIQKTLRKACKNTVVSTGNSLPKSLW